MVSKQLRLFIYSIVFILLQFQCSNAQREYDQVTYAGNSPCGSYVRSLLKIPASSECDRIRWTLTLLHNKNTGAPLSFTLDYTYGMQQQSGPGFSGGGVSQSMKGKCEVIKGTATNPEAVIYQLGNGENAMLFVKIDEAILHLLYRDKHLMIGDAGWSYTLNKIKK